MWQNPSGPRPPRGGPWDSGETARSAHRAQRPERPDPGRFEALLVPMPESASFPSGHAASAFAFAYTVGRHYPALAVPIRLLASGVAYSRVHTVVHYPGDVVLGSVLGAGTSAMVAGARDRRNRPPGREEGVVSGRLLGLLLADDR
ncbi:phosphatase PAP2 family protein [Rhodococcus tukisamuensis]|uniref:phosphatase PAP2 family protein n=1 Tax=Rhodococcus tukisamuensis TaxID=168276 RepID=UPI0026EB5111|nr:phosphatase PAP2 family protein [Rhodococcus tukisamuensis]